MGHDDEVISASLVILLSGDPRGLLRGIAQKAMPDGVISDCSIIHGQSHAT